MIPNALSPDTLNFLSSLTLPMGCRFKLISPSTYRIYCPNYEMADQVWQNLDYCLDTLLPKGAIVEVVATDYYARSHPKG